MLDAGCGPGIYTQLLAENGADVVAFDASERMVQLAKDRLGDKPEIFRANLEAPLHFVKDASFDIVVSALAMDYMKDWGIPLSEFFRALKFCGRLVFSVEHPSSTFVRDVYGGDGNYFETELVGMEWKSFAKRVWMSCYRRPLEAMINPLAKVGFVLEQVLEPKPTERFLELDPEDYEKLSRMPGFLCFRAVKQFSKSSG